MSESDIQRIIRQLESFLKENEAKLRAKKHEEEKAMKSPWPIAIHFLASCLMESLNIFKISSENI